MIPKHMREREREREGMVVRWKKDFLSCLNMSDRKAIKYLYLTRAITPLIQWGSIYIPIGASER